MKKSYLSTFNLNQISFKNRPSKCFQFLLFLRYSSFKTGINNISFFVKYDLYTVIYRDVPDPDSTIRYPVKCRHSALSGIQVKFAGYLPDSSVTYFITNIKWKT